MGATPQIYLGSARMSCVLWMEKCSKHRLGGELFLMFLSLNGLVHLRFEARSLLCLLGRDL
jgi:hypothetical protein